MSIANYILKPLYDTRSGSLDPKMVTGLSAPKPKVCIITSEANRERSRDSSDPFMPRFIESFSHRCRTWY